MTNIVHVVDNYSYKAEKWSSPVPVQFNVGIQPAVFLAKDEDWIAKAKRYTLYDQGVAKPLHFFLKSVYTFL